MGKEIKRVPLDFDWPLRKVWAGYKNPYADLCESCPDCEGTGYSAYARLWADKWYGDAPFLPEDNGSTPFQPGDLRVQDIIRQKVEHDPAGWMGFYGSRSIGDVVLYEANRMCHFWNKSWNHHLSQEDVDALWEGDRLRLDFREKPTAELVNWWSLTGLGHDGLNKHICLRARCMEAGEEIGCARCGGEGVIWPSLAAKLLCEQWQRQEPPTGEGWQVWETVSEGSPVSPVFATAPELENWLISEGYSEGAAEAFTRKGWVPTGMMTDGRMYRDIESLNAPREGD